MQITCKTLLIDSKPTSCPWPRKCQEIPPRTCNASPNPSAAAFTLSSTLGMTREVFQEPRRTSRDHPRLRSKLLNVICLMALWQIPHHVYTEYGVNVHLLPPILRIIQRLVIAHEAYASTFISVIVMYTMSTLLSAHCCDCLFCSFNLSSLLLCGYLLYYCTYRFSPILVLPTLP